jgi:uncharacterized membrane protein YdbT with pleckstrin-like domain
MRYVKRNLMDDEDLVYSGKVHWFIFVRPVVLFLLGVFLLRYDGERELPEVKVGMFIGGTVLIFWSALAFLKALIAKLTTELAVTTRRVIVKVGFIRRDTMELNHSKVESFRVSQSIAGRILNFGTLIVSGTGGGTTPIPNIDAPLEFRRIAMRAIDEADDTR